MSYDYFLFAKPDDGRAASLDSLASDRKAIGMPGELMARIGAVFPSVAWEPPHGGVEAWFGANGPEFLFSCDEDGSVSVLKAACIDPEELRALVAALGLVAFDPQKGCFIGG